MSIFNEMKDYYEEHNDSDLVWESPCNEYINDLYARAVEELSEHYKNLFIEPSIQAGRGGNFATFERDGVIYTTNWSYEDECEIIQEYAEEADTEEELVHFIKRYIESHLKDVDPEDDEEEEV